jgi:hypothetical protein
MKVPLQLGKLCGFWTFGDGARGGSAVSDFGIRFVWQIRVSEPREARRRTETLCGRMGKRQSDDGKNDSGCSIEQSSKDSFVSHADGAWYGTPAYDNELITRGGRGDGAMARKGFHYNEM